jgi:tetratricopeptide (TPR) repeat protein
VSSRRRLAPFAPALLAVLAAACTTVDSAPRDPLDAGEWKSAKARMYHDLALQCLRAQDHERARSLLQQAVQYDAREPRTLELLARLSYAAGDLDGAIGAARMLQALDPESAAAACTTGAVAEARNQPAEAEAAYRRAIAAKPADPRPLVDLHRLLLATNRAAEAAAVRARLDRDFPRALEPRLDHAAHLAATGSWPEAAAAYEQSLAARPDDPAAAVGLAVTAVLGNKPEQALALGSRLPPHARADHPSLARALAVAQLQAGSCEAALRELDLAGAAAGGGRPLHVLRGEILLQSGLVEPARTQFELALAADAANARALAGLGRAHLAGGRDHAAARALEQAVALRPANGVDRALLAAALYRTGDVAAAARHAAIARRDAAARPVVDDLLQREPRLRAALDEAR